MPQIPVYIDVESDKKIDELKMEWNLRSKADVLIRIIKEYLNSRNLNNKED